MKIISRQKHPWQIHSVKKKLPSTMSMAKNFIKSATDHIKNGMKNVAEDRQKERLAICAECPYIIDN